MQESADKLGKLLSVHRPVTIRLWLMALMALGPIALIAIAVLVIINDLSQGRGFNFAPLGCAGPAALLLALLVSILVRDFRKWRQTRAVSVRIYEHGISYRNQDQFHVCAWNEISDITHRTQVIKSKYSAPRRISVIRSIVKNDGTVMSLPETMNLQRLTPLIETAVRGSKR